VTGAIAEYWPELQVTGLERGGTRTQMVIIDAFTDVELIRLDTVKLISLHRHA
jgi:hypothetical protein